MLLMMMTKWRCAQLFCTTNWFVLLSQSISVNFYQYHFLSGGLSINCIFIWKSIWYDKPIIYKEDFNSWNSCKSQVVCGNAGSWMWCPDFRDVSAFLEGNKVRAFVYKVQHNISFPLVSGQLLYDIIFYNIFCLSFFMSEGSYLRIEMYLKKDALGNLFLI